MVPSNPVGDPARTGRRQPAWLPPVLIVYRHRRRRQKFGSRLILIDGGRLASLMLEYNVRVSPRNSYMVKTLDGDYFEKS